MSLTMEEIKQIQTMVDFVESFDTLLKSFGERQSQIIQNCIFANENDALWMAIYQNSKPIEEQIVLCDILHEKIEEQKELFAQIIEKAQK